MPITTSVWTVGQEPEALTPAKLPDEKTLEDMILAAPSLLSDDWLPIGRQVQTAHGGRIDVLALAPDGSLVVVELKRDKTPREVVAQALDYAAWAQGLGAADLAAIFGKLRPDTSLAAAFESKFNGPLDEEGINRSHQVVVVAAELDASTERIVAYLNGRDVPINVLFFQVFALGDQLLLSRSWLRDPTEVQAAQAPTGQGGKSEPWNGEFYANFGHGRNRDWEEARRFGFVSGGGSPWYSGTLKLLRPGDRLWVKAPGYGFVGVGRAAGEARPMQDFTILDHGVERPSVEVLSGGNYHKEFLNDPERCEWFVPVEWIETRSLNQGMIGEGLFGNQNTICRPRDPKWPATVAVLRQAFGVE